MVYVHEVACQRPMQLMTFKTKAKKKMEMVDQGGRGVKVRFHTLFNVWETLKFHLTFYCPHAKLPKNLE